MATNTAPEDKFTVTLARDAADAYIAAFALIEGATHDGHNAHFAAMRAMELACGGK